MAVCVGWLAHGELVGAEQDATIGSRHDPQDSVSIVEALGEFSTDFERRAALRRLLMGVEKKRVLEMLDESRAISSTYQKRSLQLEILRRFAMEDPITALKHARTFNWTSQREFVAAIFSEWSSFDAESAASHAATLATKRERFIALRAILHSLDDLSTDFATNLANSLGIAAEGAEVVEEWLVASASRDPRAAWRAILGDGRADADQRLVLVRIASAWADRDGLDALQEVKISKLDQETKSRVLGDVLNDLADTRPDDAFRLARDMQNPVDASIFVPILESWARVDPVDALNAVAGLAREGLPKEQVQMLQNAVVDSSARADPTRLLDNISRIPGPLRSKGRELAVHVLTFRDPEEAAKHVGSVKDAERRDSLATGIVQFWARKDLGRALDWASNAKPKFRNDWQSLLTAALREAARSDPEYALQAALDIPLNRSGKGLEAVVVDIVSRSDVDLAEAMLPQMRNDITRRSALESVGIALALNGESDRALKLGEMLNAGERRHFHSWLFSRWAREQPQGLFAAMKGLPSVDLIAMAAATLAATNERRGVLHDDQLQQVQAILADS